MTKRDQFDEDFDSTLAAIRIPKPSDAVAGPFDTIEQAEAWINEQQIEAELLKQRPGAPRRGV